jgi:hypothetical protein
MRSFVLEIIVIELCSPGGFPLEEESKHCHHNKFSLPRDYSGIIMMFF